MPLSKLQFRPGLVKDATDYANEGGWFSADKVRFRLGFAEKIGGWQKQSSNSFLGVCRRLIAWTDLSNSRNIGVGTNLKYYVNRGGAYYDITPVRTITAAGDVTFSATDGSATITVTDIAHGALSDDFVTFSDAVGLGGNISADVLNQEYQITRIDADTYTILAREANTPISDITVDGQLAPTPVLAAAADTGDGGTATVGTYLINRTLDTTVIGAGWSVGLWSREGWGDPAANPAVSSQIALWSHDVFGEDLLINQRGGPIYYWDLSDDGLTTRAKPLSDLAGASDVPDQVNQVMVSDRDRHVLAFGCVPQGGTDLDPMLVRFSNQEDPANWTATATNTAGDLVLGSGSEIVRAVETRQQTLVLTDKAVYSLQFLGPPFTFGTTRLSANTSIISPTAATAIDDTVVWMGEEEFFIYDGTVKPLPCPVLEYVFSTMDRTEPFKVVSGSNTAFGEIWWFYPCSISSECDRYVVYNYQQNIWYTGTLGRDAWIDRARKQFPLAAGQDGYLYYHEVGTDDGSTNPPLPVEAFIESSPIDIGDGNEFSFVTRILPDLDFRESTGPDPTATMTLNGYNYPGQGILNSDGGNVTRSISSPVDLYTDKLDIRLRARAMSLRIESNTVGTTWRLGAPRVDLKPDGRR